MSKKDPKAGIIKALYNKIAKKPLQEAEMSIQSWMAEIDSAMRRKANSLKISALKPKDFKVPTDVPKDVKKQMQKAFKDVQDLFDTLEELTGREAMEFLWAMDNAIQIHKRKKLEKYTVADLKIDLTPKKTDSGTGVVGNVASCSMGCSKNCLHSALKTAETIKKKLNASKPKSKNKK